MKKPSQARKSTPGRNPKLTPELAKKICNLIKIGNYRETACAACGIDPRTLRLWLAKGAKGKSVPHKDFLEAMAEAESLAESAHVRRVHSASTTDWKAAAWILARKYPGHWGEKIQVEIQQYIDQFTQQIIGVIEDVAGAEVAKRVCDELLHRKRAQEEG